MKSVCVFTGSNRGNRPGFAAIAAALGSEIAARGLELVYGGSRVGLMGVVADAALAAGGEVTGVLPQALVRKELVHPEITRTHIVESMHERKAMFSDLSDGFVALPGGLGTLEELFEVLTWAQLGFHSKPVGLLNTDRYYDDLLTFLGKAVDEGFVREAHRGLLLSHSAPVALLDAMAGFEPVVVSKWIDKADEL